MLQFTRRPLAIVGVVVLAGTLAACGHNRPAPAPQYSGGYSSGYQTAPAYPNNPVGTEYGRVSNIEVLQGQQRSSNTSGAGAILGAVVGGVLGNQIGGGSGRVAATAAGAVGGALLGNTVEGRNNPQQGGNYAQGYRITIQLDQGGLRAYDVSSPGDLRLGDRVRTYNGQISRL